MATNIETVPLSEVALYIMRIKHPQKMSHMDLFMFLMPVIFFCVQVDEWNISIKIGNNLNDRAHRF